jgi:membrane associated rhomboid family serine protease
MPSLGEISVTNWFLIRAIPTTVIALAIGGTVVWSSWVYLQNAPVTAILVIATAAIWGVLMYYFISHLPE